MIRPAKFIWLNNCLNKSRSFKIQKNALFGTEKAKQKDSKWIYSSKYDEMQSMRKGKIYVTTETGNDCHDVTLRMYNALMKQSAVVFSYAPSRTGMLLKALSEKDKLVDPSLHIVPQNQQGISNSQIIPKGDNQSSLLKTQLSKQQQKTFHQTIELGKFVDMEIDFQSVMKKDNDPGNKNLFQRQKQLKKYLRNRQFRTQLQSLKRQQGYPQVLPIIQDVEDIKYFYQNGMDTTYVLHQYQIYKSNKLLSALEKLGLPYQILPGKNQLVNAIVASGFPADRFSIQYFPQDLQEILLRRKKAKLTVAIIIKKQFLQKSIQSISIIFGKDHLIFVNNSPLPFRSEIHNFYDYLKQNKFRQQESYVKIIVSPFIAEFNQSLLQEQHKIRHIFGQAQSEKTNFIQLQILGDKLQKIRKKQHTHQIDIYNMTAQMIQKIKNPQIVKKALQKMLSLNQKEVEYLFKQGQKRIKTDYLGISQFINFKRTK